MGNFDSLILIGPLVVAPNYQAVQTPPCAFSTDGSMSWFSSLQTTESVFPCLLENQVDNLIR